VSPGKPANPLFIILDTSVLLQLIATDQFPLLRCLRSEYRLQSAIVNAVESETLHILTTVRKFMGQQDSFKKALFNGTISLIDRQSLDMVVGTGVDAILRQIDSEGQRLNLRVDRGEAYTHAAGSVLNVPVATNDYSAVSRLLRDDENIPRPILRFWDLIVFGLQIGHLDESSCDKTRQTVPVQPEMERGRFPLVGKFRPSGGDFQGIRVYRSDVFLGRARRVLFRARQHRLDEPTGLSLGMVASLQSPLPFYPAKSL